MPLPTFFVWEFGNQISLLCQSRLKISPTKIFTRSKQHWKDRIPEACKGYDTQSDALDRAIAELFVFRPSSGEDI